MGIKLSVSNSFPPSLVLHQATDFITVKLIRNLIVFTNLNEQKNAFAENYYFFSIKGNITADVNAP